jgi:hypothetical protein
MTVNVVRRRSKPRAGSGPAELSTLAIGEIAQTVFACPACNRPLAIGARRCPGCSTRLLLGVQAGRASIFVTVGLIFGVAFGGGLAAVLSAIRMPAHDAMVADTAAAAALAAAAVPAATAAPVKPVPTPPHTGGSTGTGSSSTIPAISASALSQALVIDTRLTGASSDLAAALAAPKLDILVVSGILRTTASDAVVGLQLTQNLSSWSGGDAVAAKLSTLYASVQTTASDGLAASIRNEAAYRRASLDMIQLLGGLGAIDGQARSLATSVGISLPVASAAPAANLR